MKKNFQPIPVLEQNASFVEQVQAESGVNASDCMQCGKCSAGCPLALEMDFVPNQIIRMVQLGMADEVLKSCTIWLCAHCHLCHARCPRDIKVANLMETLRIMAKKKGFKTVKDMDIFYGTFLDLIEKYGRVHEMGLVLRFNLKSGHLLRDATRGPKLFFSGKISPKPHRIKDHGAVKRIFDKIRAKGGLTG